jgi:iron(III) transport system ATP-binding protein
MSSLVVTGVAKSYGSTPVLGDVTLTVPSGAFAAVLGPSGSGKTTLLRLLAGFDPPDEGRIELDAEMLDDAHTHVPAYRRRIGYVPQDGLLFPHLSVAENVGFGLPRRSRGGSKVDGLLELIGLGGLGGRRPHELSGGQQQRVAVARALAPEPRLLLLDEPFAALDASLRESLRAEIKQLLASLGTTVVLVTHDQEEALSLADMVAILADGRIVQHAAPRAIYQRPDTPAVAHFLGETNLVSASFEGETASTLLGELPVERRTQGDGEGMVLIRPEQILLTRLLNGHRPPLSARVTAVTYFGHDAIARLSLETRAGTLELIARTRGDLAPPVDAHVALAFDGTMRAYDG